MSLPRNLKCENVVSGAGKCQLFAQSWALKVSLSFRHQTVRQAIEEIQGLGSIPLVPDIGINGDQGLDQAASTLQYEISNRSLKTTIHQAIEEIQGLGSIPLVPDIGINGDQGLDQAASTLHAF